MTPPDELPPELPRIAIERSPANDVYLLLSMLGSGREAERILADPLGFLRDNRSEARFVAQYFKGRLATAQPAPSTSTSERTTGGGRVARRAGAAQELRRASSLLR